MNFIFDSSLVLYLPLSELDGASFKSRDSVGHLCTVTGALWRPNGRLFDYSDDKITLPADIFPNNNFTTGFWMKTTNSGAIQWLLSARADIYWIMRVQPTGEGYAYCEIGTIGKDVESAAALNDGNFHHIIAVKSSTDGMLLYVDGNQEADVDATATGDIDSRNSVNEIGINGAATPFGGTIGEFWLYNRVLTPPEIQQNYLATKWRYR